MSLFDDLLISVAQIYSKDETPDAHGQPSQALIIFAANVPCRVSTHKRFGDERTTETRFSIDSRITIFMRPVAGLTPHHVIEVEGTNYNITEVQEPSLMEHHYEVLVTQIIP